MKLRTCALLAGAASVALLVAIGAATWSLPPQFQPEAVYRLKFGDQYPASRPVGDGTLVDFGPRADVDRYVVDLGTIADAPEVERTFVLTQLPEERFVVGFDVVGTDGNRSLLFEKPDIGSVHLEVTTASGQPVVAEEGPLSDWIWSGPLSRKNHAFVYRTGDMRAEPGGGGRADSWGTLFTASSDHDFRVRVRAEWEPQVSSKYSVRLLLKGGGWKS